MANTNFVVHNGLTVGPLTIDAVTGDIVTTGNISGAFIGISSDQIRNGGSNVRVTTDWVNVSVKGSNVLSVGSLFTSLNAGYLNVGGNVLAATGSFGAVNSTGFINTSGNVSAAVVQAGQLNTSGNVLALNVLSNFITADDAVIGNISASVFGNVGATFTGASMNLSANVLAAIAAVGTVESSGMVRANSTAVASSATTGAIVTAGGIGVLRDSVFGGNVTIDGNLFVNGNTSVFNTNNLSINDSLIFLADNNPGDTLDIGIISSYTNPGYQHTGFVRDATDGIWKLFANVVAEPTTTVDFTNATYSNIRVGNVIASTLTGTGLVLGAGAISTVGAITSTGLINTSGNVLATGAVLNALTVNGNVTVGPAYLMPSSNAASSIGTVTTRWNFVYGVNGNFLSVNANYADLAEKYLADAEYAPGTVLMFGGDQEVTECTHDMCSRVAGVVSTNPGYLMNQGLEGDHTVELALTGRVPTKVTGTVQKGDMMVSAGNGRARAEANPRVGSVIGKALENSEGDAVIEVVIGKH